MIFEKWKYISLLLIIFSLLAYTKPVSAQEEPEDEIEVYLSFSYRSAVNSVVIAYYKNDKFYLPYRELFQLLEIDQNTDLTNNKIILKGRFLEEQTPYSINLSDNQATFGDQSFQLTQEEYMIKELDYYLESSLYDKIFDLKFSVDFNNLAIQLDTPNNIPVVERIMRRNQRQLIARNQTLVDKNYELKYDRNRKVFGAGFLDYNLSTINTVDSDLFIYNASIGGELLGGDVQGALNGAISSDINNFTTDNLRWRYAIPGSEILTSIQAGQVASDGYLGAPYTGVRLTNQPIEPRRLYDEFIIQGNTIPRSEIELYLNNTLVDFQESDAAGNYRFITPLTYGTSSYDIKIFGPTGEIIEQSKRIQVPFSFLPSGEINYNVNVGRLNNPIIGTNDRGMLGQGNVRVGLSNWLTANAGVEYFEDYHSDIPTFNGGFSARLMNKYLITTEFLSGILAKTRGSVILANSSSIGLSYTNFFENTGIYNTAGVDQEIQGSLFYPFRFGDIPLNVRLFASRLERKPRPLSRYRVDLSTRFGRLNLRSGFSNSSSGENFFDIAENAEVTLSATYTFPRYQTTPKFFHGLFARSELSFLPNTNELGEAGLFVSKSVFRQGNLQLNYSRNFKFSYDAFSFGLVIDFNKVRVNSRLNSLRGNNTFTNTIRGSVGYDPINRNVLLTSRNQVGRSAAAVRLFVDYNGDGIYNEGDDIIDSDAVRIDRTGSKSGTKNGITYITQMQPYYRYNMEVNKGAIQNPLLVPENDKFALITDPNFFKQIEIPFYSSGIIEGMVNRYFSSTTKSGIGGVRLFLSNKVNDEVLEIRTFSDGSFYSYEIPPGKYRLRIDQNQLDVLQASSDPEFIDFEIKALAEGDFIEGMIFNIIPDGVIPEEDKINENAILTDLENSSELNEYENELRSKVDETLRLIVKAQNAFYSRNTNQALDFVNQSLEIFKTAQGYALRGSLLYLQGNKEEAQKSWDMATRFNPDIYIPDTETLDQIIKTEHGD